MPHGDVRTQETRRTCHHDDLCHIEHCITSDNPCSNTQVCGYRLIFIAMAHDDRTKLISARLHERFGEPITTHTQGRASTCDRCGGMMDVDDDTCTKCGMMPDVDQALCHQVAEGDPTA